MIAPRAAAVLADLVQQPDAVEAERVKRWVVDAIDTWLAGDSSLQLPQCLGIPGTPSAVRRAVRDQRIIEAATCLSGTSWSRAAALRHTFANLERRRLAQWDAAGGPDAFASRLERALWRAHCTGHPMPGTVQGWDKILAPAFLPDE